MRKTEIKKSIQGISDTIQDFRDRLSELLEPYNVISDRLDALEKAQEEAGIELVLDFIDVKETAFRDVITTNELWNNIEADFDIFIENLQAWEEESSERKAEQIRETYIDQIEEIKVELDIYEAEDEDSLDDMLMNIQKMLDEFEYL